MAERDGTIAEREQDKLFATGKDTISSRDFYLELRISYQK